MGSFLAIYTVCNIYCYCCCCIWSKAFLQFFFCFFVFYSVNVISCILVFPRPDICSRLATAVFGCYRHQSSGKGISSCIAWLDNNRTPYSLGGGSGLVYKPGCLCTCSDFRSDAVPKSHIRKEQGQREMRYNEMVMQLISPVGIIKQTMCSGIACKLWGVLMILFPSPDS